MHQAARGLWTSIDIATPAFPMAPKQKVHYRMREFLKHWQHQPTPSSSSSGISPKPLGIANDLGLVPLHIPRLHADIPHL